MVYPQPLASEASPAQRTVSVIDPSPHTHPSHPLDYSNHGNSDSHTDTSKTSGCKRSSPVVAEASGTKAVVRPHKTSTAKAEHFSLRSWIRNAPWSQYFKDGCRLVVKSPLNFFIFFCCLSVVVWGAFLVLLMGNMVKLADNATQKLWIEIASQVLNGFFTLANVPVHPKRLMGFVRGFRIWRTDKAIREQFVARFLERHSGDPKNKMREQELTLELLRMLEFYQCFPDYGRERLTELSLESGSHSTMTPLSEASRRSQASATDAAKVVVSTFRSRSRSESRTGSMDRYRKCGNSPDEDDQDGRGRTGDTELDLKPFVVVDMDQPPSKDDISTITSSEARVRVDIAEEDLNELLAEETQRVVQSVVLPFLPFAMGASSEGEDTSADVVRCGRPSLDVGVTKKLMESGSVGEPRMSPSSPRSQRVLERGSSYASLSKIPMKRASPRTRARTMTMSMAKEAESSTFVIHEEQHMPNLPAGSHRVPRENVSSSIENEGVSDSNSSKEDQQPPTIPMPPALTKEQMDWLDERQQRLLRQQERLQRAWPWYNYTIPAGIEPVDFFAPLEEQPVLSSGGSGVELDPLEDGDFEAMKWSRDSLGIGSQGTRLSVGTIMLSASPMDLIIRPSRFCFIVGSFNINSMVQEVLCGFMWGMNYHVRPGWVVGTGMALGCVAAILPSVLIMLHEQRMSRVRVVATTEEAIQDALDEKIQL